MVMYMLGYMAFTANFIQFSADQLRDAPTRCCVLFFHALLWTNSLSKTVAISAFIQHMNQTDVTISLRPLVRASQFHIYILLTLSGVHAFMSRKLHTCPVTPQEMGKVWKFTKATPLLHQVRARNLTSHIATMLQALNTSTAHTNI